VTTTAETTRATAVERVHLRAAALKGGIVTHASEQVEQALLDKGLAFNAAGFGPDWAFPQLTDDGWAEAGIERLSPTA
jgi:hypothetical protein